MASDKSTERLGRYEILAELGRGAMGVVYKAIDPIIDRTVAIKTIQFDQSMDDLANFEERFYREAKSAGRLNHPNIVTIYDVGKTDNIAYMAMEFLEGQLLKEALDVHAPMSVDRIADIVAQVADGLEYAHENAIVHRDIKPANIMLVRGNAVKITDFGIAQMPSGSKTLAGTVMGSPKYMAPEQVAGSTVDGRSDLFSLGVVLYEMLTGEPPFDGDNINTTMYRIVNEAPLPPQTLAPRIPDVFNYIVAKALAKHPDERYQTAGALAHDLRNHRNLSAPISAAAKVTEPGTADRKAGVRSNVGVETVFLNPNSRAQIAIKPANGNIGAAKPQLAAADAVGAVPWQSRNVLILAIAILLLSFTVMAFRGQRVHHGNVASPGLHAVTPVPALIMNPPKRGVLRDKTSLKRQLSKERHVAEPHTSVMVAAASGVDTPRLKTRVDAIGPSKMPTNPPDPTTPRGDALLSFAVTPWGKVYVDGEQAGASPPLTELRIPAGKHVIEIRNMDFSPYSRTIDLKADSMQTIKYIFK
ncbi:MAG: serine/threonine-protein kinase [Thiobacillaceae bacterium]